MPNRLSILAILLFITAKLYAQPGGGGGLRITNLYNQNGEKINIYSDSSIKIRSFSLQNDSLIKETFIFQDLAKRQETLTSYNRLQRTYVLALGAPHFTERKPKDPYNKFGQRLLITYKADTMMLDIYGIISSNGAGYIDRMDSLFFKKGHYRFFTKRKIDQNYIYNVWQEHSKLIQTGFTPYTLPKLTALGFITYNKQIDTSFLLYQNLPKSFFVERAKYHLQNSADTRLVFSDIENAIKKNNGIADCDIWFPLSDVYAKLQEYQKAIDYISLAINCKRYTSDNQHTRYVERNYKTRIELYKNLKQFDKALADSIFLVNLIEEKHLAEIVKDAHHKIYGRKDYKEAIADLKKVTPDVSVGSFTKIWPGHSDKYSKFKNIFYILGDAYFNNGDYNSSAISWLNAIKLGYYKDFTTFDNYIIALQPNIPELYVAKALLLYKLVTYKTNQRDIKPIKESLENLNKAQQLGMDTNEINYYRTIITNYATNKNNSLQDCDIWFLLSDAYVKLQEYPKALKYVSLAINCKKDTTNNQHTEDMERNYKARIDLYTRLKQFKKALADYNTLSRITTNKPIINSEINIEKAKFKIAYFKDYKSAIIDLKKTITSLPKIKLDTASHSYHKRYTNAKIFDSLIAENQNIPELYFCRAITLYYYSALTLNSQYRKNSLDKALKDIDKAQQLGMDMDDIDHYKNKITDYAKKYQ